MQMPLSGLESGVKAEHNRADSSRAPVFVFWNKFPHLVWMTVDAAAAGRTLFGLFEGLRGS